MTYGCAPISAKHQPIEPQTPDHNNQSTADTDHHNHFLDTTGGPPSLEVSIVSALNDENNQPVEDGDDHEHAKEEPTSSSSTSAHVTAPICESPTATDDDANNTTIGLSLTLPSSSSNEPLLCKVSSEYSFIFLFTKKAKKSAAMIIFIPDFELIISTSDQWRCQGKFSGIPRKTQFKNLENWNLGAGEERRFPPPAPPPIPISFTIPSSTQK